MEYLSDIVPSNVAQPLGSSISFSSCQILLDFFFFTMDTTLRMLEGPPKENLPYVKGILDFLFFVFMCMGDIFRMDICT